jgi:putative holliday junction resolvase
MRIAALDLGDVWVGIALSDPLRMLARPYKTVKLPELTNALQELICKENVTEIVVGEPQTLRGTASEQTQKIYEQLEALKKQFPQITWHLWDERLTSKQASSIQKGGSKEEKQRQHAVAAALILRSYLDHLEWRKSNKEL